MERDEILKAIKNNYRQEFEVSQTLKGDHLASSICALLGLILIMIDLYAYKRVNFGIVVMTFGIIAIQQIYEAYKMKKITSLIVGTISVLFAVSSFIVYIVEIAIA